MAQHSNYDSLTKMKISEMKSEPTEVISLKSYENENSEIRNASPQIPDEPDMPSVRAAFIENVMKENDNVQRNNDSTIILSKKKTLHAKSTNNDLSGLCVPMIKEETSEIDLLESRATKLKQFQNLLSTSKFYTNFLNRQVDQLKEQKIECTKIKRHNKKRSCYSNSQETQSQGSKPIKLIIRKRCRPKRFDDEGVNDEDENYAASVSFVAPRRSINGEIISDKQPSWLTGGAMRTYQLAGLEWLKTLHSNGINGILADEMGLGKTIQCIALICHLIEVNIVGPHLIIAPLSTLSNWVAEFARFAPDVPTIMYHGNKETRAALWKKYKKVRVRGKLIFPVVVTNYDTVLQNEKMFRQVSWNYIIIDEGHRIKNPKCRLVNLLKNCTCKNRLLLTGTPLHNNLTELWSLLNFLLPDIFDKLEVFESLFDAKSMESDESNEKIAAEEQEAHIVSTLHEILSPFLLRRLKSDVELFLPPKKELLVYAPLTQKQQTFYKHTVDRTIISILHPEKFQEFVPAKRRRKNLFPQNLLKSYLDDNVDEETLEAEANEFALNLENDIETFRKMELSKLKNLTYEHIKMQNVMMQLRKCCNHPFLLSYPIDKDGYGLVTEELVQASGKMLVLDALLPKLKMRGHKVLLFSQMTRMLDIIQDYLDLRDYKYSILTGRDSLESREQNIKEFSTDPENFVFLISTRAGGLGLNLIAADTVIVYDSDWNPQCDLQAVDRCHRIGQTKPVVIYRLVTANTIDQKIVDRAASKRKLEKLIMHKDKFKSGINEKKTFTKDEVLELLQAKDHEGVVQSNSTKCVFNSRELEKLLDRTAMIDKTVTVKSEDDNKYQHFKVIDSD